MENLINAEMLSRSDSLLKAKILTNMQLGILKKRLSNLQLNSNEQTYYYKFIKPKIKAMMDFFGVHDINIWGKEEIIPGRIEEATLIIRKLEQKHKNKKIMVSGSFLFNKKYNDIDVFIFTKYEKEDYLKGKIHVNFLNEDALDSLFFASLSQISVSNFAPYSKKEHSISLTDAMQNYELLINSILNKEDYEKDLRDFILNVEYISDGDVINPKKLFLLKEKLCGAGMEVISHYFVNSLILGFDKKSLKKIFSERLNDYRKLLNDYKSAQNLPIYIDTYSKVIGFAA